MVGRAKPGDERAMPIREFAAAKINLTLEVLGRRADGYHELISLVAFARDVGDWLTLEPGPVAKVETSGTEAIAIDGANLVMTIVEAVHRANSKIETGTFRLEKQLPVAAGLGGGSADAAAAIRAIARHNCIADAETAFAGLAVGIGADIPVCIGGNGQQAAVMSGIGERVWRPAESARLLPQGLAAVLVNPRVPVPTGAVFAALAASERTIAPDAQPLLAPFASTSACLAYVAASRNDLEAPAITIAPIIADVLGALRGLPACRLVRMSGSGATCFGLFTQIIEARAAATALRRTNPDWWIEATRLS